MKKYVIYTCLTGGYDGILQPSVIDDEFDYICFSNDTDAKDVGVWMIKRIPITEMDNIRLSRYAKLMPHAVLKDYQYSLYIDANLQITDKSLYDVLKCHALANTLIAQVPHLSPPCDCIYNEIPFCIMCGKVSFKEAYRQFRHLKHECFPEHYGLFENNIIFRKHNDKKVIKLSEDWWNEYCNFSRRDQFSLMYVYWKNRFNPLFLFDGNTDARNSPCIRYLNHDTKKTNALLWYIERQTNKILIKILMRRSW